MRTVGVKPWASVPPLGPCALWWTLEHRSPFGGWSSQKGHTPMTGLRDRKNKNHSNIAR